MATISYTSEVNLAGKYVKVDWTGLNSGDDGQPFNCAGLRLGSVHYWGPVDFGGMVDIRASNEISPANFVTIHDANQPSMQFHFGDRLDLPFVGAVSPFGRSNTSGANVSIIFVIP